MWARIGLQGRIATIEAVEFHEVGAVDAILDVVGGIWGISELGIEDVRCGVIRTGDGTVQAAHGVLPVPAPATSALLVGYAWHDDGVPGERVTPTGVTAREDDI